MKYKYSRKILANKINAVAHDFDVAHFNYNDRTHKENMDVMLTLMEMMCNLSDDTVQLREEKKCNCK